MGLVTESNEVSLVGTITSGGTDVTEMSASTARSTIDVVVGSGALLAVGVVSTSAAAVVVEALVGATDGAVDAAAPGDVGTPDVVGAAVGVEAHEAVSTNAATHRTTRARLLAVGAQACRIFDRLS